MLLFKALDMRGEFKRLFIVPIAYAGVHQLRYLKDLKELWMLLECHIVHLAAATVSDSEIIFDVQVLLKYLSGI